MRGAAIARLASAGSGDRLGGFGVSFRRAAAHAPPRDAVFTGKRSDRPWNGGQTAVVGVA